MKLTLAATIFAFFAMPVFAFGQQGSSSSKAPKPTKADAQKVAQIISSDKAKLQAYCDSKKLYDQMGAAYKKNDTKTADALNKQADALVSKIGPEYSKMMDGLEQVDQNSSEAKEFMAILSGLDKLCSGPALAQPAQPAPSQPAPAQSAPNQPAPNQPAPNQLRPINPRLSNPRPMNLRRAGLRPNQDGVPSGRFRSQRRQHGYRDHTGLHPTDHGGCATTKAGHEAFAANRSPGRSRLQKSKSKFRRRSKHAIGAATESVKHDGGP